MLGVQFLQKGNCWVNSLWRGLLEQGFGSRCAANVLQPEQAHKFISNELDLVM